MKKNLFIILLLVLNSIVFSEWKTKARKCLEEFSDYSALTELLKSEKDYEARLLLAFAYGETRQKAEELNIIRKLIKKNNNFRFTFLSLRNRIKLVEYFNLWKKIYPEVREIKCSEKFRKIPYSKYPSDIKVELTVNSAASLIINDSENRFIGKSELKKGTNIISLPSGKKETRQMSYLLFIKNQDVEIIKRVTLNKKYIFPDYAVFKPEKGILNIKGFAFKREKKIKKKNVFIRTFDKRHFWKKSFPSLISGVLIFTLNSTVFRNKKKSEDSSPGSRKFFSSLNTPCNAVSLGLSLKGIVSLLRSFKKREIVREVVVKDREAVSYNNHLIKRIEETEKKVYLTVDLKVN